MSPNLHHRALTIVRQVLDLPAATRDERLRDLCRDDDALLTQVRALLTQQSVNTLDGTPPPPQPTSTNHIRRIGNYTILATLGEGGMGVVYKAQQAHPTRLVALKVVRPGLVTGRAMRRFELESQTLGRLQHPGIAAIYEAATADEGHGPQPFFAMEFVEGEPLTAHATRKTLTTRQRVELFVRVCDAVHHAHQKGVIHRDLKPGNILVDLSGQPKVLDFGIARATDTTDSSQTLATEAGQVVGTLPYMSPEQISGDPNAIDTRADVYSLGVVLYELLAGRRPFDLESHTVVTAAKVITEREAPPLSRFDRTLRGDLETIAAKALEKSKERRYQSASDFAADLQRFLNNEPVLARPASRFYRARKAVQRNKALFTGLAAAAAFLVAGAAATAWQAVEATRGRALAEAATAVAGREAQNARAVNEFLVSMLSSANPEDKDGGQMTVREMVDRAAARVDAKGAETPTVEMKVRQTLANTYRALGLGEAAEKHAARVVEIVDTVPGLDGWERGSALSNLGLAVQARGDLKEGERLTREAIAIFEANPPIDPADSAKAIGQLGQILISQGRIQEGVPLLKQSLDDLEKSAGPTHPETITSVDNYASGLSSAGQFAEAEAVYRRSLSAREAEFGPDHVATAYSINNLANVLQRQGRNDDALALLKRALAIREKGLPVDHPSVLNSMNNVAVALVSGGQLAEGLEILDRVLPRMKDRLGPTHPRVLSIMGNRAFVLDSLGRDQEARTAFEEIRQIRTQTDQLADTDAWMQLNNYAMLLGDLGEHAAAEEVYAQALASMQGRLPKGHWLHAIVQNNRGEGLGKLARYADAERELLASHEELVAFFKLGHARVNKSATRLAAMYEAWGKSNEAAKWASLQNTAK